MSCSGNEFFTLNAKGISVTLDLVVGHIRSLVVERDGRRVEPLHKAPWIDAPPPGCEPVHLARLAGDFLCAPFGASGVEGVPLHGWPANSAWSHLETRPLTDGVLARFELGRRVMGARVIKEFTLRDGHPFLYQRHIFEGGHGRTSVAMHLMVALPEGGKLAFSPKRFARTPARPLETDASRGRCLLAYPAHFHDLCKAPLAEGGTADLTVYPIGSRHEDFVMLAEAPGNQLAWAAALRCHSADLVLSLKNPDDFPLTMLWMSNGGRYYSPWNGRHSGVLGIEEGRIGAVPGLDAPDASLVLDKEGIATSILLEEDGTIDLRQVTGVMPVPAEWGYISHVISAGDHLFVTSGDNKISIPYDSGYLFG